MDQNNQSNGFALRIAAASMLSVLCCMAGGSPVFADAPSNDSHGTVSSHLTVADLDLANPADVAIARERIHQLARKLCGRVEDLASLSHQPDYVACVAYAMAKAEPRLQQLAAEKVRERHLAGLQR
jgi:UrcA family protein